MMVCSEQDLANMKWEKDSKGRWVARVGRDRFYSETDELWRAKLIAVAVLHPEADMSLMSPHFLPLQETLEEFEEAKMEDEAELKSMRAAFLHDKESR